MEIAKPIAIAFSDHHMANWKQFNKDEYRLRWGKQVLDMIIRVANKRKLPLLFCGDLIDHPKYVDNRALLYLTDALSNIETQLIGINGNHDQPRMNTFKNPVEGYLHSLERLNGIKCIDFESTGYYNLCVHGIPYIFGNVDFIEALEARVKDIDYNLYNILLIHRDLAGAEEPDGKIIEKEKDQDKTIKKLFKHFDLVLSGHIHKPQQIKQLGNHVYMLGATHQQRRSDSGCDMGYWIIYDDMTLKFKALDAPKFRYHGWNEEPENDTDFWIQNPKPVELSENTGVSFSIDKSRKHLVKAYMTHTGVKSKRKLKVALKYI